MELTNVKKLFTKEGLCDTKHKINTTNKDIPASVLETINKGITIEQLEKLSEQGYDIYKYSTQITLHGICKELTNESVNFYKSLILNKNQSIGIKWVAVDNAKKCLICNKLKYFGWNTISNSTELHPSLINRFEKYEDAVAKCNEYKAIAEKIDGNLFFGSYQIYIGEWMGLCYAVFDLLINGIKEENVNTLIEQVTGKSIAEVEAFIKEADAKREAERKEWERKYDLEREQRKAEAEMFNKQFAKKLENEYIAVDSTSLKNGDIFYAVRPNCDFKNELVGYIYGKRTCKPLNYCNCNNNRFCTKNCKVYIKK
jgi:hypothetical protein